MAAAALGILQDDPSTVFEGDALLNEFLVKSEPDFFMNTPNTVENWQEVCTFIFSLRIWRKMVYALCTPTRRFSQTIAERTIKF